MLKVGITSIALLVLGTILHVQPTAAQTKPAAQMMRAASKAQRMGPEIEKLLSVDARPALVMSFGNDGAFTPFRPDGAVEREMDDPVPPEAQDVKSVTIYFYRKNPHCYSYWNGSKWVEVCPRH